MTLSHNLKTYVTAFAIVLVTAGIIYLIFFYKDKGIAFGIEIDKKLQNNRVRTLFPHGTKLDISVLRDERFKYFVAPTYPLVDKSEIGNANPFDLSARDQAASQQQPAGGSSQQRPQAGRPR